MNDGISKRLAALHPLLFVLAMLAATYVVLLPQMLLSTVFESLVPRGGATALQGADLPKALVLAGFVAPLYETIAFQWLPIRILRTWLKRGWPVAIGVSAVLFAVSHPYGVGYVLFAFAIGLILAYGFAVKDVPGGEPGLLVFGIHSLRNVTAALLAAAI